MKIKANPRPGSLKNLDLDVGKYGGTCMGAEVGSPSGHMGITMYAVNRSPA